MKFDELRETVQNSEASDWHRIDREGPTYRDRFSSWSGGGAKGLDHDSHPEIAIYKADIDLTIAYGLAESHSMRGNLTFQWSEEFADPEIAEISVADVFWRGSIVDRVNYVYVDGAGSILPLGEGHQGLKITRYEYSVARLLGEIGGHSEFDRYFNLVPYEFKD